MSRDVVRLVAWAPPLHRRLALWAVVVGMFVVLPAAATRPVAALGASPQRLIPILVSSSPFITNAPIFIAIEEGYFAEQGIEVTLIDFRETAQVWPVLISGRLDVHAGALTAGLIQGILQGARLRIVADRGHTGPGDRNLAFLVRQDLIDSGRFQTLKDLRGMRINVGARASLGEMFVVQMLRNRAFLTERDVKIEQVPATLLLDALRSKALDAGVLAEPLVSRFESLGLAKTVLTLHDVLPRAQYGVLAYGPNLLARNPGLAQRFMNAYLRGVQQYNTGKTDRNVATIRKYTRDDEALLRRMSWPLFHPDGHVNIESILQQQAWWVREGWLERMTTPEQFLEAAFARRAFVKIRAGR